MERKEYFGESASATSLSTARNDASMSAPVVDQKAQPLPEGQRMVSGKEAATAQGDEAKRIKELLEQFSEIRLSVEQGLKEADSAEVKGLQKVRMMHFIDSGGQPAFFDIHPVIATSRAVYLLVYNMEEGLEAKPKITYRTKSFPPKDLPNKKYSNLDMIKDSLLTLQNCKLKFVKMERELRDWFDKPISGCEDAVPVLVIGSRKKEGTIVSESEKLSAGCGHLPNWIEMRDCTDTGMKLFAVNSKERGCKGVQSVRDEINKAECVYHLQLPISWVLCQLIFWSAGENLYVLTYAELRCLCLQEKLVANFEQFLAMIRAFHLLGIFAFPYFDLEQTLGDQWNPDSYPVFTNPDVLYQQVTKILEVAFHHLEKSATLRPEAKRSLAELQRSGILKVGTLDHLKIKDKLASYSGFHSYLMELLVQWGLAARLASKDTTCNGDSETQPGYFIPSVLPACEQQSPSSHAESPSCSPNLAFTFQISLDDGTTFYYVPRGIFPHMVTKILAADKGYIIPYNRENRKFRYRDAVTFWIRQRCTMKYSYTVRLTDNRDHISILIQPSDAMNKSDCDCQQIIQDFQSAIKSAYEGVYRTSSSATLACPCPCHRICKNHLAAILPHQHMPAQYILECLSAEEEHWVQECPRSITNIVNGGQVLHLVVH